MRVCVVGCAHGEVEAMYEALAETERKMQEADPAGFKPVDLVVCCGDFQACRSEGDLLTMACPPKYRHMHSFHLYYHGLKQAPKLTVFIGGNHEASNHMQELPYGGWAAPNIYYLGHSGVVRVGKNLVIGGVSGIYNPRDYSMGRFERTPFGERSLRTVFHVKRFEVRRLEMLPKSKRIDVFLSHDWPDSIACQQTMETPEVQELLRLKPFFEEEVRRRELGSPVNSQLLGLLKPRYWFSAHMHVKFAFSYPHQPAAQTPAPVRDDAEIDLDEENNTSTADTDAKKQEETAGTAASKPEDVTRFLCLDKIVPGRDFMQIVDIDTGSLEDGNPELFMDRDWLAVIKATHAIAPKVGQATREKNELLNADLASAQQFIDEAFPTEESLRVSPSAFVRTVHDVKSTFNQIQGNPQTDALLAKLQLGHTTTVPYS